MPVPGQQPQQPRSVYDDIADQDVQNTNRQIAQAVAMSTGNNPDQVGQAQQVGAQVGMSADLVMQHMDEIKKSIAAQQVQERDLASWNPMLARQLADPDFAAIAHDNIDNLQTTGTLFQRFKASAKDVGFAIASSGPGAMNLGPAFAVTQTGQELGNAADQGYQQYERGMLGIKVKRGEATADDWTRIHEIDAANKAPQAPIQTLGGQMFGGLANMAGNMAPMVPRSAAVGGAFGAVSMGTAAETGPGALAAGASGFGLGFESEFGAQNYEMMAGNAYTDMIERGVDHDRAQWAAGAVGAVNTALQLGLARLAGKPLGKIASTAFNRALGTEVADAMTQPTTAAAVKAAMLAWGKHTAIGTGEMGLQTIVDRVGNDYADQKGLGGTASDLFSSDFGHVLGKSLVDAALTMGTINATTGMMGFSADMSRVQKAEQSASFFENLSQNAVDSKVRGRNPNAYENFIANQAQGTGAENIYIEARQMGALLHQSGIDPAQLEQAIPGIAQQLADTPASGDVTIPTSQYAARLAGTDLGKAMQAHMRLDPDAMSATEALDFQQKQQELFTSAHQEAQRQMAASDDFAKSAKVVEGNIFDQLKATKTMPDDVARTNAQFVRDFVVTQAARQGMTPEAFFDKYKYTIQRASDGVLDQGEGTLSQSGEGGKRGGYDPTTLTTLLGQKSDASSFLHETSHYFLSVFGDMAKDGNAPADVKEDFGKLLNWFGVKDQATWDGMSLEDQRQHHEKFAYSFEKYLAEGKSPSIEAQGMFGRFSQWLKRVYKSVRDDTNTIYRQQHGEDLPIMTGEVRDVMDRMLASDEQIKQAQAIRNMEPVFKSQEASGMSDAEWKAYGEMGNTATDAASAELGGKSIREMQWMSNAKGRLMRAMQAQHERIREGVRSDVRDEMTREEPVYRAQRFLKTGEWEGEETSESHKMDTEETRKLLPEGQNLGPLSKLFGMTKKGGIHPDDVAAAAGFKDGQEMVDAMLAAPALKDAVDAETDRRMLDQHGDMATPNAIATAVEKAIHNEARARFIAFEMRHAFNMDESERVLVQAARETARKAVERQKFAELQPSAYAAREAAAARQAIAAQARGDMEGVGRAKRDQLLQNAMASEALRVKAEADQTLNFLNKFDNPSKAITKAIGADHMDAINELLAGYQVSPRERYSNRRENMAVWINAEYSRTGVMPTVPDAIIDKLGSMHWKDMNIVQLRDLRDAVKSLDYTGRQQTLVQIGEKQQTVDEIVDSVQGTLADLPHTPVTDIRADLKYAKGLNKLSAKFLNLKSWVKSADAALVKMEQFFQWIDAGKDAGLKEAPIDGPMQRIYRLASNAEATERTMRAAATAAMREVHESLKGTNIDLSERLDIPELPREGTGTRWYRGELIAAALNMGNQSNAEKLLAGYGWEHQAVLSAINRLLSPEEMSFVQGTWDHLATYGDGIRELQRRQTGVSPQMIESTPLVTKHGTFSGGYYPVVFNDVLDETAAENQARNADKLFENNYANPQTASGHTITRTGYVGPLFLDLGVIARHIDQVTHDLAWREAVIDMNKVLSDPRLKTELNQVYGPEYSKQFRPWLQAMANDKVFNTAGDSALEKGVKKVRSNFTMVGIGFRMSTMAIHGTSALSNSLGELGPVWFAKGAAQFAGVDRFQQARDFMYERSPEMANRMNEADRNVHEAIRGIEAQRDSLDTSTAARQLYDNTRKFAFRGVGILDMASAGPTWMGAYLKGMAHEGDGGMGMGEDDAIAYADRAVRNAHGGGGTKDLSSVQRDKGVMSLATMFYSYWNHVYNRQRDLGKGWSQAVTGQAAARDFPKLLARSWFYLVVPALAHSLLAGGKKKDDDGTLEGFAKESAEGIGLSFVSGIPVIRDIANAAVHGTDYAISPLEKAGQAFVNTFKDVKAKFSGDETKRGFQNTAETLGYATGLPTAQPAATAKFLYDVFDGDQRPEDVADWWRGVLTGKIK